MVASASAAPPAVTFGPAGELPPVAREMLTNFESDQAEMDRAQEQVDLRGLKVTAARLDLNGDHREDLCVSFNSYVLFGNAGAAIACFLADPGGKMRRVLTARAVAPESLTLPGTRTKGFWDVQFGGPGTGRAKVWRWAGGQYG